MKIALSEDKRLFLAMALGVLHIVFASFISYFWIGPRLVDLTGSQAGLILFLAFSFSLILAPMGFGFILAILTAFLFWGFHGSVSSLAQKKLGVNFADVSTGAMKTITLERNPASVYPTLGKELKSIEKLQCEELTYRECIERSTEGKSSESI